MMRAMELEPLVVWGVVVRGLGALFVLAHASLLPQIVANAGARGLAATKRAFPGPRRFIDWPTLLWLHSSDGALRAIGVAWRGFESCRARFDVCRRGARK